MLDFFDHSNFEDAPDDERDMMGISLFCRCKDCCKGRLEHGWSYNESGDPHLPMKGGDLPSIAALDLTGLNIEDTP